MNILALDPSGNFTEGSGTTGWAFFENGKLTQFGDIVAKHYETIQDYWDAVATTTPLPDTVVCESYKLFAHKAKTQSWSAMETPQLIGYLRMFYWERNIPVVFQDPALKVRVADDILVKEGVFEKRGNKFYCQDKLTNLHMRDAIRHGVYYLRYHK